MFGCGPNAVTQGLPGLRLLLEHGLKRLLNIAGASKGQSSNDCTARKNLRVRCEHNRSHGATSRETGHKYFAAVSTKCRNRVLDHFPDGERLSLPARGIAWQ